MTICEYKRIISRDGKPVNDKAKGKFKTHTKDEAYLVISNWNEKGKKENGSGLLYRYDIVTTRQATITEMDDESIQFRTGSNC